MGRSGVNAPRLAWLAFALMLALAAVGCSPESQRARGGGPGADVGNRNLGPSLDAHGPVDPLYGQPLSGRAVQLDRSGATPTAK